MLVARGHCHGTAAQDRRESPQPLTSASVLRMLGPLSADWADPRNPGLCWPGGPTPEYLPDLDSSLEHDSKVEPTGLS